MNENQKCHNYRTDPLTPRNGWRSTLERPLQIIPPIVAARMRQAVRKIGLASEAVPPRMTWMLR